MKRPLASPPLAVLLCLLAAAARAQAPERGAADPGPPGIAVPPAPAAAEAGAGAVEPRPAPVGAASDPGAVGSEPAPSPPAAAAPPRGLVGGDPVAAPAALDAPPLSAPAAPDAAVPPMPWEDGRPLGPDEVYVLGDGAPRREHVEAARRAGLLVVDLSDGWAPFLFSDSDEPGKKGKPNRYRETFVALANDRADPDEIFLESPVGRAAVLGGVPPELRAAAGGPSTEEEKALLRARRTLAARRKPNFLEVYGIPPTLSVLARRIEADAAKTCFDAVDVAAIRAFDGEITFQSRDQARQEFAQATAEVQWMAERMTALGIPAVRPETDPAVLETVSADPEAALRLDGYRRAEVRLNAVRAVQDRLACEGLFAADARVTPGQFDLATHLALADFEKKNDVFGWGFLGGETQAALVRSPMELHFDTFRRILAERVADAAGIVEDGSATDGEAPATYRDEQGAVRPVPNSIGEHVSAALAALRISRAEDLAHFLRAISVGGFEHLRVAVPAPALPPYYAATMDLRAEIDRGDVWYDLPFDATGKLLVQRRRRYPTFTLHAVWNGQKIPLVRWRTTIGSWRSELHPDGNVYLKYKNSDVGPRIWKNVVAGPVWLPPDSTPAKDLLTRKLLDVRQGPVTVPNTEVLGPGFASAYGLAMAIHLKVLPDGKLFDNGIRTHGSVDYTSIARRFSHGCHRLVNNRAVRLFDFVLRHRKFVRLGNYKLDFKRKFQHAGKRYEYALDTRGYWYELKPPMPIDVLEGRILGNQRQVPTAYVRKPGVAYRAAPPPEEAAVEAAPISARSVVEAPAEAAP